jgi:hypothetical protein
MPTPACTRNSNYFSTLSAIWVCLFLVGCQAESSLPIVVEYHPKGPAAVKKVSDSQVYVLWRLCPVAPLADEAKSIDPSRPRLFPVEMKQVYVSSGSTIGFLRDSEGLKGIAGRTTTKLEESPYQWTLRDEQHAVNDLAVNSALGVIYYGGGLFIFGEALGSKQGRYSSR